jgi:Na+-driven multidrug efflux pump
MKKTILLLFILLTSFAFAQEVKEVTLTEIGQGKTKEAAKYSALRSALEKAFGIFISSNTTIFKDELVKDEIVSVSSGNIQNFEILS